MLQQEIVNSSHLSSNTYQQEYLRHHLHCLTCNYGLNRKHPIFKHKSRSLMDKYVTISLRSSKPSSLMKLHIQKVYKKCTRHATQDNH